MRHRPSSSSSPRGYALVIVLMVLALLSVGLGTFFTLQTSSARITGNLIERRRVFYACDGISRAATVLAQNYALTAPPTTSALITEICTRGGGGCCAARTVGGSCAPDDPKAEITMLTSTPKGGGPSALPNIVPPGFKIMDLELRSLVDLCKVDDDCSSGTCVAGRCRTVAPLSSGPFSEMMARQDTVSIGILAEHRETTKFRCSTLQTLTLGKIAMFQFFLFSDAATTDWHPPGSRLQTPGRVHVNGDLHLNGNLKLQRITATGDLRVFDAPGVACTGASCTSTARLAAVDEPDFGLTAEPTDFALFKRADGTWRQDAIDTWQGNVLDNAHGVPRLQLRLPDQPDVQRGYNGNNDIIANTTAAGPNTRLLVDPVRAGDPAGVASQKFSAKSDIRIINGVWYLNTQNSIWPGTPIWSDHGSYVTSSTADFVGGRRAGQMELRVDRGWDPTYTPRRFSYYAMKAGTDQLIFDDAAASTVQAVVSYGSLFRENSRGEHAPTWRPGVRTLRAADSDSWCETFPSAAGTIDISHTMLDALALDTASTPCTSPSVLTGNSAFGRAAGLLAATRSGFRDGFAEHHLCTTTDSSNDPDCAGNDRREANVMPMNIDIGAFQQALADTMPGELGSYFCAAGGSCLMGRSFNGILYVSNPYPGSEDGYGVGGGGGVPGDMPAPIVDSDTVVVGVTVGAMQDDVNPGVVGNWTTAGPLALLRNNPNQPVVNRSARRDDEVLALAYPLCSDQTSPAVPHGMPGSALSTRGYIFRRPLCGVDPTQATTWVTGVRVINARVVNNRIAAITPPAAMVDGASNIKPYTLADAEAQLPDFVNGNGITVKPVGKLPAGLSLITNNPLYVVGDVNITSAAFDTTGTLPWVPVLLGADTVHPFSNAWDDRRSRWAVSTGSDQLRTGKIARINSSADTVGTRLAEGGPPRAAQVTRFYMQLLSGWGEPVVGAPVTGVDDFPLFNENWSNGGASCGGSSAFSGGCPSIIAGSLAIGFNRVYTRWPFSDHPDITRAPSRRDWSFDTHLNDLAKQPPGAPLFDVSAVKQWRRN